MATKKRETVHTEPLPSKLCYSDKYMPNAQTQKTRQGTIQQISSILIGQDEDPVLLNFNRQKLGVPFQRTNPSNYFEIQSLLQIQKTHHIQI